MGKGEAEVVLSRVFVKTWQHHVGLDDATEIVAELDRAGYKIMPKDKVQRMLDRVKALND